MKFRAAAGTLADAIQLAAKVTSAKPKQVALGGVLLSVDGAMLTVIGTDSENTVAATVQLEPGSGPGTALVVPKPLCGYLDTLRKSDQVTVETSGSTRLSVCAEASNPYVFNTLEATLAVPPDLAEEPRRADLSGLPAALAAVKAAAGSAEGGDRIVQLVSTESSIRLAATDGHRLHWVTLPDTSIGQTSLLLSLTAVSLLPTDKDVEVRVESARRVATFATSDRRITVRPLSVPFPPIENLMGTPHRHQVRLPAKDMLASMRRLEFVGQSDHPLDVNLSGRQATLGIRSGTVGSGTETVQLGEQVPADLSVGISLAFLKDALTACDTQLVELAWTSNIAAMRITPVGGLDTVCLVMPVRMS